MKGAKLNLITLLLIVPFLCVSVLPFALLHGWQNVYFQIKVLLTPKLFALLFLGIAVHEALHALTWMLLLKRNFSIIKFGFNLQAFSPYTHCKLPMKAWQYKIGGIVPGIAMGIIPIVLSFVLSNVVLNFVGFLFLWAASGDIISLIMLRTVPGTTKIVDHPDEMGYIIVKD